MINKKAYIASKCEADLTNYDPNEMKAIAKFLGLYDNGIFENISVDFSTLNFPLEISYSYHEPEKKNPFKIDMKKYADILSKTYEDKLKELVLRQDIDASYIELSRIATNSYDDYDRISMAIFNIEEWDGIKQPLVHKHLLLEDIDDDNTDPIISDFITIANAVKIMISRINKLNIDLNKLSFPRINIRMKFKLNEKYPYLTPYPEDNKYNFSVIRINVTCNNNLYLLFIDDKNGIYRSKNDPIVQFPEGLKLEDIISRYAMEIE